MPEPTVHCAARWDIGVGAVPGGPVVTFIDERHVEVDGRVIIVAEATYIPERIVIPKDGSRAFESAAEISALLPMENGAVLDIFWTENETVGFVLGTEVGEPRPNRGHWVPLREVEDKLVLSHQGCKGPDCDQGWLCLSHILWDPRDESPGIRSATIDELLAIWRRLGSKPVVLTDPPGTARPRPAAVRPKPTLLEERMKVGQTITRAEWEAMNS